MKKWAVWMMAPVLALSLATAAAAQSIQRPQGQAQDPEKAAQAKKEAAQRAFASGLKSYEAGKFAPAAQSLTVAVQSGGLSSQDMAKALYYRGVAYRKEGKSAQAIADLTSAIWLKNGLSGPERSDAEENRAAAYREAGVAEGANSPLPWARVDGANGAAKSAAPAENWQTAAAPPVQPAEPDGAGSGVGGFFSNLFSGFGSSPAQAPPAAEPPPPPSVEQPPPPAPVVSDWSEKTTVTPVGKSPREAALAAKQPPPSRVSDANGKYRLQVATVRSREEADATAARIRAEHAGSLGQGALAVDETVVGSMGTFYRVQAGPYRTAEETDTVCKALKASGYDCLVVTQ